MNQITLVGNLGGDPEKRAVGSDNTVVSFSVADTVKKGQEKNTQWFRCEAWNKQGDVVMSYVKKGDQILVLGQFIEETYTNKEGEEKKSNKIRVSQIQLLSQNQSGAKVGNSNPTGTSTVNENSQENDDLPF